MSKAPTRFIDNPQSKPLATPALPHMSAHERPPLVLNHGGRKSWRAKDHSFQIPHPAAAARPAGGDAQELLDSLCGDPMFGSRAVPWVRRVFAVGLEAGDV